MPAAAHAHAPADLGRVFVDTGAFVALLSARDDHHTEADGSFRQAAERHVPLVTTNLVVAEAHRLILFRAGIAAAKAALQAIDSSKALTLHFAMAADHAAARRWLAKLSDQVITYTDAVSFAVMERLRCRAALSFDHDFVVAGFRLWEHEHREFKAYTNVR